MSLWDELFGSSNNFGGLGNYYLNQLMGLNYLHRQQSYLDQFRMQQNLQAALGNYQNHFYQGNIFNEQNTNKKEVKVDHNVIDAEFEVIEVKELEKK